MSFKLIKEVLSGRTPLLPLMVLVMGVLIFMIWSSQKSFEGVEMRLPNIDSVQIKTGANLNPAASGTVIHGPGVPGDTTATWPQFRGPDRNNISPETNRLPRMWSTSGLRQLWAIDCGEGYAGVVVGSGRVYLMDYDARLRQSIVRCLSFADGREIWRYAYPLALKRNHGVTRTVPALKNRFLVAMDSMCNVLCLDASTGELFWSMDLVREYGTTVPPWYAGQCPLIDEQSVILAPGGSNALVMAVDLASGKPLWQSTNPHGWKMTHSSVAPMSFEGRRFYTYCASGGVVGVSATDGSTLWETSDWKISIANVPVPLALDDGKIFLCGGYNSGSMLLQLKAEGDKIILTNLLRLAPEVFGATQQTPVYFDGKIYGIRPNGQFVCLDTNGGVAWASPPETQFGLGSFMLADGCFYILNDNGRLTLVEASSENYHQLAEFKILKGIESWAPMAIVNGRLFARDFTRLVCLDLVGK